VPDVPPIPPLIWCRLLAFLREGKTGSITLDVHRGAVRDAMFSERVRSETDHSTTDTAVVDSA
jgi:hypothetical protein